MRITNDEKAAQKILDAVNDYTLNTYMIGFHIFQFAPMDLYVKLEEVMEGIDLAIKTENERVEKNVQRKSQNAPF
jgi:hypothetical protein